MIICDLVPFSMKISPVLDGVSRAHAVILHYQSHTFSCIQIGEAVIG